jgi:hypothetical protein
MGVKVGRCVRLTTSPPSVSRLSREIPQCIVSRQKQCNIVNILGWLNSDFNDPFTALTARRHEDRKQVKRKMHPCAGILLSSGTTQFSLLVYKLNQ